VAASINRLPISLRHLRELRPLAIRHPVAEAGSDLWHEAALIAGSQVRLQGKVAPLTDSWFPSY